MLVEALTFLATNKVVIIGATTCVCEVLVIVHNFRRKLKSESIAKSYFGGFTPRKETFWQKLWWSANPINVLRKP